jgi:O-antigen/teichoic acid export membrane protein
MRRGDSVAGGLVANYLGKAVVALLTVLALPVLYQQLGGEGFGLFGFFYSLLALITLMDFGLAAAVQRDLASDAGGPGGGHRVEAIRRRIRSVELPVALVALVFSIAVVAAAGYLSKSWLTPQVLSHGDVAWAIRWMALAASGQLLCTYYAACLNGLSQFKWVNSIQTTGALLRFAAMLSVAGWLVPNDFGLAQRVVGVFAAWATANLVMVAGLRLALQRNFQGDAAAPHRDWAYVRKALVFGMSVAGVTLLIMVFNQVDKFAASRALSLEQLGLYAMVWSLADVLYLLYQPIYTSFLPLLAASAGLADRAVLHEHVRLAWDCMSLAAVPVAVSIFVLPHYAVWAWTGDAALGTAWGYLLGFAMVGALVNAYLFVAFALQQANGRLGIWVRRIAWALALYAPAAVGAVTWLGAPGGVIAWSLGTVCLALSLIFICFSEAKYSEVRVPLYWSAIKTIAICLGAGLLVRLMAPAPATRWMALAGLMATGMLLYGVAALTQRRLSLRILDRLGHMLTSRGPT